MRNRCHLLIHGYCVTVMRRVLELPGLIHVAFRECSTWNIPLERTGMMVGMAFSALRPKIRISRVFHVERFGRIRGMSFAADDIFRRVCLVSESEALKV
jgi:hypothetical protein